VLAWLAGQTDVVQAFTEGRDVYSEFATKIYKKPISKDNPIERFVGKTCILGLGYGTGALKLQHTLKTQPPGAVVTEDQAREMVNIYREENDKITDLWAECDTFLENLISWGNRKDYFIGKQECVSATPEGILLPNNFYIRYPQIKKDMSETKTRIIYESRKGPVSIWGGSVVENIVQALARCVIGEQILLIAGKYRPALTVHDAIVCVVPEDEVEEAKDFIVECMNVCPDWAPGLPITCEAKYGRSYGDC
jgi:DNA polymerase I-like protein with 3'-5' exonuclease and polymerase domains